MSERKRIAFVKFAGLSAGGTEKWLQMVAANLNPQRFDVEFFYCDAAPYIGSDWQHPGTCQDRVAYMQQAEVRLREFQVGRKDVTQTEHPWLDTNFWDVFDDRGFDLVQTAKAGHAEYPYLHMQTPVIEYVTLNGMVDSSPNTVRTVLASDWIRNEWISHGGDASKSGVIGIPVDFGGALPVSQKARLNLQGKTVYGFHQRSDDMIFSPVPLQAYRRIESVNTHFLMLGGSQRYQQQAQELGLRNVTFLPSTGDAQTIAEFLATLDVYAHGRADGETFGHAIAEAMALARPVVSHVSWQNNGHVLTVGEGGMVTATVDEYAEQLVSLQDENLRERVGRKGFVRAQRCWSLPKTVRMVESVYDDELGSTVEPQSFAPVTGDPKEALRDEFATFLGTTFLGDRNNPADNGYSVGGAGIIEREETLLVKQILENNPCRVFFDVGANTGWYGHMAAQLGLCSWFFEPVPLYAQTAQAMCRRNGFADYRVFNTALGASSGSVEMHFAQTGTTAIRAFSEDSIQSSFVAPLNRLDDCGLVPDFIKIDVEGYELEVLRGAVDILRTHPILFIEIAQNLHDLGRSYQNPNYEATFRFLVEHGYHTILRVDGTRLMPLQDAPPRDGVAMFLCCAEEIVL